MNAEITDDEDFLELIDIIAPNRKRPVFRNRQCHFEKWTDTEFLHRFRLPKQIVRRIVDLISNDIANPTKRNHALTPEEMVLMTLRFYATGSMMIVVGDFLGVDKSTSCRTIHKVSDALARLYRVYIRMPENDRERREKSIEFYRIARFPKCIGALDCTHIKIQSPGQENAEIYRNRKGYFSINVQAVCDASLNLQNLQNIVCRWPGSTHDSTILNNSTLELNLENGLYGKSLLVGDSGYAVKKYLITPLSEPNGRAEHLFNESQIRTRNPIERCFGVWKRRFPILALGLRVKVDKVEAIVIATGVLHNIANSLRTPVPDMDENIRHLIANDLDNNANMPQALQVHRGNRILNNATRLSLIQNHFARLL